MTQHPDKPLSNRQQAAKAHWERWRLQRETEQRSFAPKDQKKEYRH